MIVLSTVILCYNPIYHKEGCDHTMLRLRVKEVAQSNRASQKSEVKKASQSGKMKGIKKHFHSGETHDGLYDTASRKPRRPRAACQGDAIALPGVPTGGGWAKGTWEAL